MTPGPTQVPESSLLAMARQVPHHRTPEFRRLLAEVFDGLKYVFQTRNDVLILASSGTGAMEAAVANLVPPGGKAIVLESGKFSERWRRSAQTFGIQVVRHEVPWGQPFDARDVARLLDEHPDTVAVFTTLMETSTGVGHDIEAIGRVVGPSKALLVVDGISGVGAMPCRTDAWQIDVLVVGGQKALMAPPGLAFLAVSPAAWRQIESIRRPVFYFDLLAYRKASAQVRHPLYAGHPAGDRRLAESLRAMPARRDRSDLGPGESSWPRPRGRGWRPSGWAGRFPPGRRRYDRRLLPARGSTASVFASDWRPVSGSSWPAGRGR